MNATCDVRIAIADDHPVIRHAVANALGTLPGFAVVTAARSGHELLNTLGEGAWDLIITDLSMDSTQSETDGLNLIARLRRHHPSVPILVFTMLNNDDVLYRLSRAGVAGIVDKCEGVEEFQTAAQEIMRNHRPYYSERIRNRLGHSARDGSEPHKPGLTKKELEVVRQFVAGIALTDIARQLHRSISTVATQKTTAMKKLRLRTNAELVKYAQDNGLA
ncbi:response regulator transcription factor [Paraburkholderia sp. LEh10]|uniref:response regulator transcription factor n=1 Tax=Paraburkholderia sp. LEh10 TaxID=2821353 RepID=UPI001AE5AAB4|nr:response regulator transcription factor [Paraburkholderia sp. LEh10]MBP0594350.1 response regulator transcription factor [Paraburkholderia sp. LEh10]